MSTKLHAKSYNNNRSFLTIDPNEEISQNDPVRVVDSIVENPDLKDFRELYKGKGRCPYHPKMMHKIILYSYMNNVYSCRKIERQVQRDIHYIWLAAQERPDSVTINRFRNRVMNEINNIFTQVVPVLAEKGRSDPQQFQQKRQHQCRLLHCGKRGIRTPGGVTLNGFQDRRNRPLCHLSYFTSILRPGRYFS